MNSAPWKRLAAASIAVIVVVGLSIDQAQAADKDCMTSASEGQDARDQGRLVEARAQFQRCAQIECPAPIPTYCGDWLREVERKIPSLVIRVVDGNDGDLTDASVLLDERPLPLDGRAVEVDPGKHRLRVSRPGSKPSETEVMAAQGEKDRRVLVRLAVDRPRETPRALPAIKVAEAWAPSALGRVPTASWVAWGIGAAGLLSFTAFGLKARLDYDNYASECGSHCSVSARDSVASTVTVADISLVIGLVGAGVGTVLWLLQPKANADARWTARMSEAR
ncbi:hypothetical protein AKJ09_02858 [Labilithrix luteola]|uniref:PEGA domain-containing protein n=1 Tax=Labilithrix luteola TaxID=1391654 RepID=A0A0K1PSU3_9BACT|nr:hypothetical protein [Labilithrix luteola]AKU96194.1 hypothetical protein AKJ09_02858 [Labilithrix luteola]